MIERIEQWLHAGEKKYTENQMVAIIHVKVLVGIAIGIGIAVALL